VRKLLFIFLLSAFFLAACSGLPLLTKVQTKPPARATYTPHPARPTPNAAEREISDPAEIIEVAVGNQFTITVKTYLPKEYHWGVDQFLDSNIVEYVWKHHLLDKPDNPNSPGRDIWRFQAVGSGRTTITLGYYHGMTIDTVEKPVFTVVVK
jgi:predicted secreted protein